MSKTLIAQGAEAELFREDDQIIKDRVKKSYRLPILDERLRKQRTKREAKILEKASTAIPVPKLINSDEKNKKLTLEFIRGKKLAESLDNLKNSNGICKIIGKQIAFLHDINIIHGDLTTSNMILSDKDRKVYFIDFGLSFESSKAEDKAVDLHLIKQALEAKHFAHYESFWKSILEGYKSSKNYKETFKRLEAVEKRGRYKQSI
jgi:TP53 regulating kinase-like protein